MPKSVALADVDGDGALDLAVANQGSNTVSVLRGNGDGTFLPKQDVAAGAGPAYLAVADIDRDGKLDLATANSDSDDVSVLLGIRNKATHFQVDGPANATAGTPIIVSVLALTAENMRDCLYNGTATFSSTDPQALLPADYAVQLADDGEKAFSLTLKTVGSHTITLRDAADNSIVGTIVVGVAPAPASAFVVAGFPSSTTAGIEHTLSVTAYDPYGNLATTYTGTVTFGSSDPQAVLPANYTFVVGDNGAHSFNATLKTAGTKSITATDTANGAINGTQAGITVNPAAASALSVSGFPSPTTAGAVESFTVTARDAYGNVSPSYVGTVEFSSTDPQGVLPANYTFTAGDNGVHSFSATLKTAATQTLTATDSITGSITGSQSGIGVNAAAANTMLVTGFPSSTTAGVAGNLTVTLADAYGNVATGYTGTVQFSSTDPQAALPANYTFTAGDNGSHSFSVTLKTAGTHSLTATDTGNGTLTANQSGIVVNAAAVDRFLVWTYPMPMTAGAASTFQVTAKDAFGNTTTGYTGTVTFSSSDAQAVLPTSYTFAPSDNGTSFFSFTMKTAGTHSLTATDTVNAAITGTKTGITVVHAHAASYSVIPSVTSVSVGKPMSVTITVRDPYSNVVTNYGGTVHLTSTDANAVLPPDYTFAPTDNGVKLFTNAIIFNTIGSQTLTATDTIDSAITGGVTILVVNKKPSSPPVVNPVTPTPPPPAPIGDGDHSDPPSIRIDATLQLPAGLDPSKPADTGLSRNNRLKAALPSKLPRHYGCRLVDALLCARFLTAGQFRVTLIQGDPLHRTASATTRHAIKGTPMLGATYSWFNRRHFLKHVAGMSALALPGMHFIQRLRAETPKLKKENKSLIVLWMSGGPPSIDIWDMKPGATTAGEFKPKPTSVSGIEICEHMPSVAQQMKHLSLIRSLVTNEGDHARGRQLMHTSHVPSPLVNHPSIGSVASYILTPKELSLPGFIAIGRPADGPGFLGMNYAPFTVQNPGQPPENIQLPDNLGNEMQQVARIERRKALFDTVESNFNQGKRGDAGIAHRDIYKKAFNLVASKEGKVFDLRGEKPGVQEEYGNNGFGRGCLLARRLVEAGVTCVEVDLGGWDLHQNIFPTLRNQRLPVLDKAMGALVKDLVLRGMWKNTVVVWMGEFGRTPRINQNAGRDHWARCWAVALGGGALKSGQVIGATDAEGMSVSGDPYTVGDLFATLYKGLGLDPAHQIRDNLGRPMPIAEGKPIGQLV